MKRLTGIIIALLVLLLVGLGIYSFGGDDQNETANETDSTETTSEETADADRLKVGVIQFISHPSLDSIADGVVDALAENGYVDGETIDLDIKNGQGDQSNLSSIATQFVNDDMDVIIAIATPAAQAAANATSDIPIVLAGITDPEEAGLVESNEEPGGNVTGVSDMTPVADQLELIRQLHPDASRLGVIYASSEVNGQVQADLAEELAPDYDFEPVIQTVSSTNDVNQVSQQLANEVDVMWVPNDNIVASAFPTVIENANAGNVGIYPAVDVMVAQGGVATIGINQYGLGHQSGLMAVDILDQAADPATTPVQYASNFDLVINYDQAELLGIEIPEEMQADAVDASTIESGEE